MRLFVTGASGFVGRSVVMLAAAARHDVRGLARSEAAAQAVAGAGGQPARLAGLDAAELARALEGADALVHLAQIGAEAGAASYARVNVEGTRRLLAAARAAGVPRLVFFSGLGVARYGLSARCTNAYFLSKLLAEAALFESGLELAVFRPSYIVGPGDAYVPRLARDMAGGDVEQVGDGGYRLQPIAVRDAAGCALAAAERPALRHAVFDLVGPEPLSWRAFVERVGRAARALGKAGEYRVRELAVAEAERAARAGGYRGMGPDELDCLLCDEVGDPRALEALLGRFLTPLDDSIAGAVRSA